MNEQEENPIYSSKRPTHDDQHSWRDHWKAHNQPWRTEPEIDEDRQSFLIALCLKIADIQRGEYPFKNVQLSRADVEWLLATPKSERELFDWDVEYPNECKGLDLRGADLRTINLNGLPLSGICGGLTIEEWLTSTQEERNMAKINFEEAILYEAHLEGAVLGGVNLKKANLYKAHLEGAILIEANFEEATLIQAHLEGANLDSTNLKNARLRGTHSEGADLTKACLEGADLYEAVLCGKYMCEDELNQVRLWVNDFPQILPPTNIQGAHLSKNTKFESVTLGDDKYGGASIADVEWEGVNLTVVDWTHIKKLGDECEANKLTTVKGRIKSKSERLNEYKLAVRANRQLAVTLQGQGLNEDAARFTYRAQLMQRKVLWYQHKFGQYLFSLFLDLLAGYGYRPGRCFIGYTIVIILFATIYHILGTHLAWNEAIVISMTAFHGRGFFPEQFHPGDPQALVAAIEAFVGLLIEVTFIATLTRRLFGQ